MQPALLEAVSQIASDPARRIYAVMDGARFDDLPAELSNFGLAHRSLYRSVQDIELVKAGPWLIDPYHLPDPLANVWGGMPLAGDITPAVRADTEEALSQRDLTGPRDAESYNAGKRTDPAAQIEKIIQLTGELPAAVFWAGDRSLSEPVLWRHLRGINMVLIPANALPRDEQAQVESDQVSMVFRHADANVMAQVLPCLKESECHRLFGPALSILFHPDVDWAPEGLCHFGCASDTAPLRLAGLAFFSNETMTRIEQRRKAGMISHFKARFRSEAPRHGIHFEAIVDAAVASAEHYGLETFDDISLFAETEVRYGPKFELRPECEEARYYLQESSKSATERIYYANKYCVEALENI